MRNVPLSPLTLVLVALLCGQAAGAAEAGDPKVVDTDVGGVEAPEIPVDEVAPKVAKDAGDLVVAGYLRALAGINSEGSRAACFQLAGAGAKYRLGNECEVYGELFFGKQIVSFTDGASISANAMFSLNRPMAYNSTSYSTDTSVAQAYLAAEKLSFLNGGALWAGLRYYKREDIHINDFFYWNPQGLGGGVEDIAIGGVKVSLAMFTEDNRDQAIKADRYDFQVRGLKVNPNGELEFGYSAIPASGHIYTGGDSGWSVTVQHRQTNLWGEGWNKFAVQYGVGPGTGLGSTGPLTNTTSDTRFRVVEGLFAQMTPKLGGMLTGVYQKDESPLGDQTWLSIGGRLVYGFTDHLKLQGELGHDQVRPSVGDTRNLTKLTIAPTLAMARGFWARPELRFFYTYARWNEAAARAANGSTNSAVASTASTGIFASGNQGSTIGLQFEGWW
ncbi:maltoporin [Candidatus Accumulibacter aalborgensis]|nr:carbohydrate porin [Candidatus Accumulibacter aalborgensis]